MFLEALVLEGEAALHPTRFTHRSGVAVGGYCGVGGLLSTLCSAARGCLGRPVSFWPFLVIVTPHSPARQSRGGLVIVPGEVPPTGPPGAGGRPPETGS